MPERNLRRQPAVFDDRLLVAGCLFPTPVSEWYQVALRGAQVFELLDGLLRLAGLALRSDAHQRGQLPRALEDLEHLFHD